MDNLHPGRKVQLLEHAICALDHGIGAYEVVATKDSIGVILSYKEYSTLINKDVKDGVYRHYPDHAAKHLAWVKSVVTRRTHYPVRLEVVVPLSEDDYAKLKRDIDHLETSYQVGAVPILPTEAFVGI